MPHYYHAHYYHAMHKNNGCLYLAYVDRYEKGVLKIDTKKKEYTKTIIPELEDISVKIIKTAEGFEFYPLCLPDVDWPDSNLDIRLTADCFGGVTVTSGDSNENTTISEGTYESSEIESALSGANYGRLAFIVGEEYVTSTFGGNHNFGKHIIVIRDDPIRFVNRAEVVEFSYGPYGGTKFAEVDASLGTYTFTVPSDGDEYPVTDIAGTLVGDGISLNMGSSLFNEGETVTITWDVVSQIRVIFTCMEFERIAFEPNFKSAVYNIFTEEVTINEGELTVDVETSGGVPVVYGGDVGSVKYNSVKYSVGDFSIELDFGDGELQDGEAVSWLVNPKDIPWDSLASLSIKIHDYEVSSYLDYDGDYGEASVIYRDLILGSFFYLKSDEIYFLNSKNMTMIELTEGVIYNMEGEHDLSEIDTCYFVITEDALLFFSSECIDIFKEKELNILTSPEIFFGFDHLEPALLINEKNVFYLYRIDTFNSSTGKFMGHVYKIENGEIKNASIEMPENEAFFTNGVCKNYVYGSHMTPSEAAVFVRRKADYNNGTISDNYDIISEKAGNTMYGYVINRIELPYRG